jgi:Helix-turn-helix domain of resolvase/Resolvase, N terminal domain
MAAKIGSSDTGAGSPLSALAAAGAMGVWRRWPECPPAIRGGSLSYSWRATKLPIDTGTAASKCFLDMARVFPEFETNLRKERQLEGIAKAKAAGVYQGRRPSIDSARVREIKAQGLGAAEIAKALGIGRASVYRVFVGCGRDGPIDALERYRRTEEKGKLESAKVQ